MPNITGININLCDALEHGTKYQICTSFFLIVLTSFKPRMVFYNQNIPFLETVNLKLCLLIWPTTQQHNCKCVKGQSRQTPDQTGLKIN